VFLGIEENDNKEDIEWICGKLSRLRIFPDENGVMNLDIVAVQGDFLVVSQFTLHASTRKGNRPSYIKAARPETAVPLYESFTETLARATDRIVETGEFGGMMQVELVNDGPVTIIIDSKLRE
jgi:D-aminoacyl-tRNA deacylase